MSLSLSSEVSITDLGKICRRKTDTAFCVIGGLSSCWKGGRGLNGSEAAFERLRVVHLQVEN